MDQSPLAGTVALVAGATRGCGRAIAVELGRAGAHVYATGRSSRTAGPSEMGRRETIEDTGDLIVAAGGAGTAVPVDHEDAGAVAALVARIGAEHGRLDVLVNDIFGGDRYLEWGKPIWEHDLAGGLRMLRMGIDTHLVTIAHAVPLMLRSRGRLLVEVTDGPSDVNAEIRPGVGFYYDFVKGGIDRLVRALARDLADTSVTPVGVTPGWLRSEAMLDNFGVTEETWRDAIEWAPGFAISETPTYVARGIAALAADPQPTGIAGRVLTARDLSDRYGTTDVDGSRPDAWGYIRDHGFGNKRADLIPDYR
jgi:NAD(P)-dependent dehydrogenase (short-subunit alcohol dehydrogenase family)